MPDPSSQAGVVAVREAGDTVDLVGSECPDCRQRAFPPRAYCPDCLAQMVEWDVTETPTLETYSEIHVAASRFDTPYLAGFVRLESAGIRAFAPLLGPAADFDVGTPLEPTVAEIGGQETWAFRSPGGDD